MHGYAMTINGRAVDGAQFFPVINPAKGIPFAEAPECTPQQLDNAIEAAQRAFGSWRQDEARRRQMLRDCAPAIEAVPQPPFVVIARPGPQPLPSVIVVW